MSSRAIDEIEDRLTDLVEALREVGAADTAEMLERHGRDFTVQTQVRRSVNAIRSHLERWREHPSELPESPKVMLAANRLEDECREALAAGVIAAAAPTLAVQSRRKLAIALTTLLCGVVALVIPIALVRAGVDFDDLVTERVIGPIRLPRGEEGGASLSALSEALVPEAVRGAELVPRGECKEPLPHDATCAATSARLWAEGRIATYELKLPNQAYGLLFSITGIQADGNRIARARLLLAATDDTPEGRYEIPFEASYLGYTPQSCDLFKRLSGDCPKPRTGQGERHTGVLVPTVIVEVLPGDPTRRLGEKRRAQAEAEEAHRKAEERAAQIGAAVQTIEAVLLETEKLLAKRRFEQVRERVRKLAQLFEPLEGMALSQAESDALPVKVGAVRARFESLRDKLAAFENRTFEQTFVAVTAESNRRVPEDSLLQRMALKSGISADYVRDIYTDHAEEIQRRQAAREQLHMDTLKHEQEAREKRCGALPTDAWRTVDRYVREVYAEPHVEIVLGECMTPRITDRDCWEIHCDYQRRVEVAVERPKVVTNHSATFYLLRDRVVRHHEGGS
jgi:hypothetical protein